MLITTRASLLTIVAVWTFLILFSEPGYAQTPEQVPPFTSFIFNTFWFLIGGCFIVLMAAGFTMLEAGFVHRDSVGAIAIKNIATYGTACATYFLIGYSMMYPSDWSLYGFVGEWRWLDLKDPQLFSDTGTTSSSGLVQSFVDTGYADKADVFFQMVFVATPASIVSGALAERARIFPFMLLVVAISAIIYPVAASWSWGGGWLAELGFADYAGGAVVHGCGGAVALAAAIRLKPRRGRFKSGKVGRVRVTSIPLATLGVFLLWIGFFGFNGGSQLGLGSVYDVVAVASVLLNTNLAGSGGVIGAIMLSHFVYGKIDASLCLNGALGGLVAITADPLGPSPLFAFGIGIASAFVVFGMRWILEKLKIDDVVGATPVHLGCGLFSVLVVAHIGTAANAIVQAIGAFAIMITCFILSYIATGLIAACIGFRASEEEEDAGLDKSELRTTI